MRVTSQQLKRIIREEIQRTLSEGQQEREKAVWDPRAAKVRVVVATTLRAADMDPLHVYYSGIKRIMVDPPLLTIAPGRRKEAEFASESELQSYLRVLNNPKFNSSDLKFKKADWQSADVLKIEPDMGWTMVGSPG